MKTLKLLPAFRKLAVAGALVVAAGSASAESVPLFPETVDFSSLACQNYGDFVSCSAQYLNLVTTGSVSGTTDTDYVLQASQGLLQDALMIFTGGAAAVDNTAYGPNVDNAYQGFQPGATPIYGTSIQAGEGFPNIVDPTTAVTGETSGPISNLTAWDIGLEQLITALTIDGVRHDLLIMFDNNQVGTDPDQNILAWALVCVRDSTGGLSDQCFELVDPNGLFDVTNNVDPTLFDTTRDYGDTPPTVTGLDDPVLANGTICVDTTTLLPTDFNTSSCPAGSVLINNNLGTNVTEFIVGIPELNAQLEAFLALGYDLVSVQFLFTNNNDGFEDIFIMAGAPRITRVPEPGTIALLGLGLIGIIGIGAAKRRRRNPDLS